MTATTARKSKIAVLFIVLLFTVFPASSAKAQTSCAYINFTANCDRNILVTLTYSALPRRTEYLVLAQRETGYKYQCRSTPYSAEKCSLDKLTAGIISSLYTTRTVVVTGLDFTLLSNNSFTVPASCNLLFSCYAGFAGGSSVQLDYW